MSTEKRDQKIKEQLEVLIQKAREKNRWLNLSYDDQWFSPDELQAEINEGNFLLDPRNFEIQSPELLLDTIDKLIESHERARPLWKKALNITTPALDKLYAHKEATEKRVYQSLKVNEDG